MNGETIPLLIVDDDPVFAHFLRQLVLTVPADATFVPRCVDSAEKAMTELGHDGYQVVLLDYHLPQADGLQMLAHIQALPAADQPAVIMLTGSGSESVAVEAMKRGAKDYLRKTDLDVPALTRALHSALLQKRLGDQVAAYNAQMRADLEMARHLQQSLLPDHYPSFPPAAAAGDSALRFEHRFVPAAELAGDFFSVQQLSDTRAGVFICDVMGHGVRAALVTAMMRALVDSEAARAAHPGEFLTGMNRRLCRLIQPVGEPMFVTAFYLVVDLVAGSLHYAAAGHPRPLHLQPAAGRVAPLPVAEVGSALGLVPEASYVTSVTPLTAGDVVLLFTDGLFEVVGGKAKEDYGKERLLAAARHNLQRTPGELCDALLADVRRHAGGAEFADDVCLLSLHVARLAGAPT